MHKLLFQIFAFLILTSLAQAYPHIGDKVQWTGSLQLKTGTIAPVHITKEVVGFNGTSKKWRVKYVAAVGDKITTEFIETADLYTPDKHKKTISACTDQGGVLEDVSTSIGKYRTCKLTTKLSSGMVIDKWWGDIPFGIVVRNTTDFGEVETPDLNAIARDL